MDSDYESNTRITWLVQPPVSDTAQSCLVVIRSPIQAELGRCYALDKEVATIGRGRDNDIVLANDCVSRRHARLERRDDGLYAVDLSSTNGTFVNEEVQSIRERALIRGDQLRIGDTIFKYLCGSDVELQYHEILFRMSMTDGLTNLGNRKQLDTLLAEEMRTAQRTGRALSLMMLDIDHFKIINDTHGHLAGDSVLRSLATLLQRRLRQQDRLGRYGGEEFCIILPQTGLADAVRLGEELRTLVASHAFVVDDEPVRVTISIGVSCMKDEQALADLYRSADEMLYRAKRTGRNKVCWREVDLC